MSRGMVRRAVLGCVLLLAAAVAGGQPAGLSLGVRVAPAAVVPLGDSADLYKPGFGAGASVLAHLGGLSWLAPALDFGYTTATVDAESADAAVGIARAGVGAVLALPLGSRYSLQAEAAGGYFGGRLTGDESGTGGGFYGRGGLGFSMFLSPRLSIDAGASYLHCNDLYRASSPDSARRCVSRGPAAPCCRRSPCRRSCARALFRQAGPSSSPRSSSSRSFLFSSSTTTLTR